MRRGWGPSILRWLGTSAVLGERSPRSWLRLVVGTSAILLLSSLAGGCGGRSQDSGGESGARAQLTSSRSTVVHRRGTGEIKPVRWSAVAERRHALRLGVEVPYCGYREPEPFIERVERRQGRDGLIFTVFVRFGPEELKPRRLRGRRTHLGEMGSHRS